MSDLDNINSSFEQRIQSVKSKEELQSLKTEFFAIQWKLTSRLSIRDIARTQFQFEV